MHGIKRKFQAEEVKTLITSYDFLVITETHLNILSKCPEDFMLLARSKPIESATPRGGVAVYKNISSEFDVVVISQHDFKDCIIFKITPIEVICIAMYIPPSNTKFFTAEYMENLQLLLSNFKDIPTCLIGDMNARLGQPPQLNEEISYKRNPDQDLNSNGRALLRMLKEEKSFHLLNGLQYGQLDCDSELTYFQGKLSSQNDISLVNYIDMISQFKILDKNSFSDHKPISVTFDMKPKTPLEFVANCAVDTMNHDHYDINKKVLKAVRLSHLDIPACINAMDMAAVTLKEAVDGGTLTNNELCNRITNIIYSSCKVNKKRPARDQEPILQNMNCTSYHYLAIAEANFRRYNQLLLEGKAETDYSIFLNTWLEAEKLAKIKKKEEMNMRVNESWKNCKNDGKSLWKAIDWKGKSVKEKTEEVPANVIHSYFKGIFQSAKTKDNPTLKEGDMYPCVYIDELDKDISIEEVNQAFDEIGTGTGLDGIAPEVLKIIPTSMRLLVQQLFNQVYSSSYPIHWQDQLLLPHPKKGHMPANPQLRGVAIGALLSRVYDKILNKRFKDWYIPNKEQAGFREMMGCLLQIFVIYLLMELANAKGCEIFVAFMDYEKAFDFVNRKRLIDKLCNKNSGKRFVQAIHSMYETTSYVPKISNTRLGERITTKHGVTQGKESSANLYSFYVSDMPSYLEKFTADFMDPFNLVQLADDTATLASLVTTLCEKVKALFSYSDDNDQIANVGKTKYIHLSKTPHIEPLLIDEDQFIESAHEKGYVYLGSLFISSNILAEHILANINIRMVNINKFYAWLQYNADTPIKIKILVLYNGVFSAILYAAETWGDMTAVSERILQIERKALKRCLGIKSSTPNDLLYIELNRADVIATVKDRQHKFYQKLFALEEGSAVILDVLELCKELTIVKYYEELHNNHRNENLAERKTVCTNAPGTYCRRYAELTNLDYCPALYESFMREDLRIIITRWRMSCIDLAIETGRYDGKPREERLCMFCDVIEDEHHAIFNCKAYNHIRDDYRTMLEDHPSIQHILNPKSEETATQVGMFLKLIEAERYSLLK